MTKLDDEEGCVQSLHNIIKDTIIGSVRLLLDDEIKLDEPEYKLIEQTIHSGLIYLKNKRKNENAGRA